MKKNLCIITVVFLLLGNKTITHAQTILSVSHTPVNPSSSDTIKFFADCIFPSGDCLIFNQGMTATGTNYYAYAMHCLGMASFVCSHTDTFIISPIAAGNYNFIFHLESGMGPNCTPGIVAGPTDTLAFFVSSSTGIDETSLPTLFNITPNPSNGNFIVEIDNTVKKESCFIELFNLAGTSIRKILISDKQTKINIDLPSGIYLCRLSNHPSAVKKIVVLYTN